MILPFISVTALVASSGEEKHTKAVTEMNGRIIHLGYCLGSFLGGGEAHKPKSLRATFLVHDLCRSNSSVGSKFLSKSLIINGIIEVLNIQVDTLISVQPLKLQLLEFLLQLLLPFCLFLGSTNVQGLAKHLYSIEFIHRFFCRLRILERHKSKPLVLS